MPDVKTYSFGDIYATIGFQGVPLLTINGTGVGQIDVARVNDNTVHEVAADGVVMPSKIKAANGNLSLTCLQTSLLHTALQKAFSFLESAPSSFWASGAFLITSPRGLFETVNATGVSFVKPADKSFQRQGQYYTWNFLATNIQYL